MPWGDCPFLTVKKVFDPGSDPIHFDGVNDYCLSMGEESTTDGWVKNFQGDSGSLGGCGMIYKCCAYVIPVACRETPCGFWNADVGDCRLASSPGTRTKMPKAAIWAQEYLYKEDLDDDGRIYGHDWFLPESECPPALANIPPKVYKIPEGVKVTEFKVTDAVREVTDFSITAVNDQTGENAVIT